MARRRSKEPSARHVSRTTVLGLLAKVLGVRTGPEANMFEVIEAYQERVGPSPQSRLIGSVTQIYPWVVDNLAVSIMNAKPDPMVEEVVSQPGAGFIVKDNSRFSSASLWLVISDPNDNVRDALTRMGHRGLRHTFSIAEDDYADVMAFQMKFCSW